MHEGGLVVVLGLAFVKMVFLREVVIEHFQLGDYACGIEEL